MTQEDIIRMAEEAGWNDGGDYINIERFFALAYAAGAAAEREAFANDWEALHGYDKHGVAAALRARGQA
jgi:hypothetical protein